MRKERRRKQQNRSYSRPVGVVCLLIGLLFAAALLMTAEDGVMHYAYLVEQHLLGKGIFCCLWLSLLRPLLCLKDSLVFLTREH